MIDIEQARLGDLDELVRLFEAYRAFYRCELDAVAARAYLGARLRSRIVRLAASLCASRSSSSVACATGKGLLSR